MDRVGLIVRFMATNELELYACCDRVRVRGKVILALQPNVGVRVGVGGTLKVSVRD